MKTAKKVITISFITIAIILLITFGIKTNSFNNKRTTTPNANKSIQVRADNQLTDLTNTTWILNQTINPEDIQVYDEPLNFTSNNNQYNKIGYFYDDYFTLEYIYNNQSLSVYSTENDTWINTNYRTINIQGGQGATDTRIINWLYNNATSTNIPTPTPTPQPTYEVIDITGLMFQILTLPFSFITQAFNITLWEGTPYQFNFSNFILSLIAIATLIFIIKLFTSGFSVISNYTSSRDNREFKRSQTRLNNAKTQQIKENKPQIKHTYIHKDKE